MSKQLSKQGMERRKEEERKKGKKERGRGRSEEKDEEMKVGSIVREQVPLHLLRSSPLEPYHQENSLLYLYQ